MNASTSHDVVFAVVAPGLPVGYATVAWSEAFGKWVASSPGGRYATGDSPSVVLRSLRKRFGHQTELEVAV